MGFLRTLSRLTRVAVGAIITATIALLLAIMIVQIVLRYGFNASLIWAEEACRYLLVWVSFLAAASAYERGELASVTMFRDRLPRRAGLAVAVAGNAIAVILLGVLVWYGVKYAQRIGSQPIPALSFLLEDLFGPGTRAPAMFWVYVSLPVGLALLAVRLFADMIRYAAMFGGSGHAHDLRVEADGKPVA